MNERLNGESVTEPGRAKYPHVFKPVTLGPVTVDNCIYMGPTGLPLEVHVPGYGPNSKPAEELGYYYAERAAAGVGLIFHSSMLAPFAIWQGPPKSSPILSEALPSFARVAEMVHAEGAKIMSQLFYHPNLIMMWGPSGPHSPQLSATATQSYEMPSTRYALRKDDIRRIVGVHAQAARNLMECGYDGIELHACHGTIIETFLSPYFNFREDEYGGSMKNRARFILEILEGMREATQGKLALGARLTVDERLPGSWNEEEFQELLAHLTGTGLLDFVDLDVAIEPEDWHRAVPPFFEDKHHNAPRVERVRHAAGNVPVLSCPGHITTIQQAENFLGQGIADMIGIGRGLMAEPELVSNALKGRESESRACIAANHCHSFIPGHSCALNPTLSREREWGVRHNKDRAPREMRVVVVGAGPTGMEAARTAAMRGHRVTLLERNAEIGGALNLMARLPAHEHMAEPALWWKRQLDHHGVDLRLGVEASADDVLALQPDAVILATGASFARQGTSGFNLRPIPGWDQPDFVLIPEEILDGTVKPTGRILVIDEEARHAGSGIAEYLRRAGAQVSIVTTYATVGQHLGGLQRYALPRLREAGVEMITGTRVVAIGDRQATLLNLATGVEQTQDVDFIVVTTMRSQRDALAAGLEGRVDYLYLVGDALAPRSLAEATFEGHKFARLLGEDDMPESVIDELLRPARGFHPADSVSG